MNEFSVKPMKKGAFPKRVFPIISAIEAPIAVHQGPNKLAITTSGTKSKVIFNSWVSNPNT